MINKFGIGIITTQNRQLSPNYLNLIDNPTTILVELDLDRTGVANTRNRVLKKLYDSGCEYFTLFDDDCYPTKYGWQSCLKDVHESSGVEVLIMPMNDHKSFGTHGGVEDVHWGIGSFTSLTRKAVETIGYFNTEYDTYGYEDVGYLFRARRAGLTRSYAADSAPENILKFIYSADCDMDRAPIPETMPQSEKDRFIAKNGTIFEKEISNPVNYYPYVG